MTAGTRSPERTNGKTRKLAGKNTDGTTLRPRMAQGPTWPDPLDARALYGLAGKFVRKVEPHTEADGAALLIQFLVAFGNVIGRGPYFRTEADHQYTNLYAALVGQSAKGRKGTSYGQVMNAFRTIGSAAISHWLADCQASGLSTGEGLIWSVRDPILQHKQVRRRDRKTIDYEEVIQDRGVEDKRLLVTESEFASVLKVMSREGNTLSPLVRDAWDRGNLRSMTKSSPARATGAHISIIGHVTAPELRKLLTATEAGNGFGNRFLWVCVRRSKMLPDGGCLTEESLNPIARELGEVLEVAPQIREMRRDDEARALWHKVYPELSCDRYGLFGAVTTRAEAQVVRLSCLYALLDQTEVVTLPHLMAAIALWHYCEQSARYIFGDSLGDPVADEILSVLKDRHPSPMSRTDIREHFQRHRQSAQIGQSLQLLRAANLADCRTEQTSGRPAEIWFCKGGLAL